MNRRRKKSGENTGPAIAPQERERQESALRSRAWGFFLSRDMLPHWLQTLLLAVTAVLAFFQYEQWRATTRNTEISNRAWLLVSDVRFVTRPEVGKPARVLITFQNFGHIPARDVHLGVITSISERPCGFVVRDIEPNFAVSKSVVGPGAAVAYPLETPPYRAGLEVKGLITYTDSLGDNRTTNFTYKFDSPLDLFVPCPNGNTFE